MCMCVTPVTILWVLWRWRKLVHLFIGWTAVLTAVQVLQHKFLDALPVDSTHARAHIVTLLLHYCCLFFINAFGLANRSPWYKGSVGERRLIVIQAIKQLGLGGVWRRQCFGANPCRRPRGQFIVSGCGESLLSCWIGWFQTLSQQNDYSRLIEKACTVEKYIMTTRQQAGD